MPPLPKRPELRQRTNKATTRATLPSDGQERKRAPRLPKRGEGDPDWHPMTRSWWRDVWHSPMATEYVQADLHGLSRLAVLIDEFWENPTTALASEIRLEQQAFGLTPIDRRRLEWQVAQTEDVTTKRHQRHVRQAQAGETDARDVLKVVK